MPNAAILAAALTDHSTRYAGLYVGGVDVLKQPGQTGVGVPIDTVNVTEAGPGGVSSMTFYLEDPTLTQALADGMDIRLHHHGLNWPIFTGWVQAWHAAPAMGGVGRAFDVTAIGVEVVLDWAITAIDLPWAAGTVGNLGGLDADIQRICANSVGLGPLRVAGDPVNTQGSQAFPTGARGSASGTNTDPLTIPAGTTVREAIRLLVASQPSTPTLIGDIVARKVTVDFYYGLRVWQDLQNNAPSDYTLYAVGTALGPGNRTEGLSYDVDAAGIVRGVLVKGTGVTQLVMVSQLPGQIAVISDTTITTVAAALAAANAYLLAFRSGLRGSFAQNAINSDTVTHPGGFVRVTDPQVGLAAQDLVIGQVGRTFNPSGTENRTVTIGGLPPSGAALLRRLTRSTLS